MKNDYEVKGDKTVIKIKRHGELLDCWIDTEDLEMLSKYDVTWYAVRTSSKLLEDNKRIYAQAGWRKSDGKRTSKYMHSVILGGTPKGKVVDHIDGDGLNNTRSNLSVVTQQENVWNKHKLLSTNTSGFTGVSWNKRYKKWKAEAWLNNKNHFLGFFDEAEKAYEAVIAFKRVCMPYLVEIGNISRSQIKEEE